MSWYDKEIDSYYSENKGGLFGKKFVTKLIVYSNRIEMTAFSVCNNKIQKETQEFFLKYTEIKDVYIGEIDGKTGIIINYYSKSKNANSELSTAILLEISEMNKWVQLIKETKETLEEAQKKEEEARKRQTEQLIVIREKRAAEEAAAAVDFYESCYNFHIKEDTPVFELFKEKNKFAAIYVGEDKSLNFLKIDGYEKEESNAVILYNKIHYYEKAGTIHYVADINGSYSSYGGSFTGGKYSKLATAGGGLLFGMMGMTAGALLTYKPAELKGGNTQFKIESDVKKIDERSVILNFYSDIKKQFIDIELPADIYNFLQTYLPEKKHNIVLELEKKAAIQQASKQIESGEVLRIGTEQPQKGTVENEMEIFKMKLDKLKMMKDADILTEEEFKEEKAKLLKLL